MQTFDLANLLNENSYPGRGIVIGKSADGKNALIAYFIMGRSVNSRNRIFERYEGGMRTKAFDESKLVDPSLIIYNPFLECGNSDVVTNGDQTDTVYEGLEQGKGFAEALRSRQFEPDFPNFTPRISGMVTFDKGDFTYQMSILKSIDEKGSACARQTFEYPSVNGLGHFIHTYVTDGNPIPTFVGEPERVATEDDIDEFATKLWCALNANNKISLYVRYTNVETGEISNVMINKNN